MLERNSFWPQPQWPGFGWYKTILRLDWTIVLSAQSFFNLLIDRVKSIKTIIAWLYAFAISYASSFGLWFGSYAESLIDDLITLHQLIKS